MSEFLKCSLTRAVDAKGILTASSFASDTRMPRNDGVEAPRYKKRKQREQTVIKAPAREQPNDVATPDFSRMEIRLNNAFFFCRTISALRRIQFRRSTYLDFLR